MKKGSKKIAVLYHGNCPDGFTGAWAAWKKFGERAEYIGLADRDNPPRLKDKRIYMIDWAFNNRRPVDELRRNNRLLVSLDHHMASKDTPRTLPGSVFDAKRSGAALAWRYFHPQKPVPAFLKYIEDHDLWRFRFKDTEAVSTVAESSPRDFKTWSGLVRDFEDPARRRRRIADGYKMLLYRDKQIEAILGCAKLVDFKGFRVFAVNSPVFRDRIGHTLARRKPPFAIVWREEGGKWKLSLRALRPFDLLKSVPGAKGHPQAAGMILPIGAPLPWKEVKSKR